MDLVQAVILGLLQGLTEWLPVSSSGHLVLVQKLMGLSIPVAFDVMLHTGTLLAVIVFFRKDILKILKSIPSFNRKNENFRFLLYILVGSIPTAIIGFLFLEFFESLFTSLNAVAAGFFITGVLLLSSKFGKGGKKLNWLNSLLMGMAQGAAIAPGISRSGSTISVGLLNGVRKTEVFRYSFLLSIPAIIGANIVEYSSLTTNGIVLYSLVGMVFSAISGYVAIKIVQKTILSEKFNLFAIYCFIVGIIAILI